MAAAFGRLCVETRLGGYALPARAWQPPSGGCVLKLKNNNSLLQGDIAAAFGRLCVETLRCNMNKLIHLQQPPSGGCVLKLVYLLD